MAILNFEIKSILGGKSPMVHGGIEGQFLDSQAIDPEESLSALQKPGGSIMPIGYSKFSSTVPSGAPMWLQTNPINQNTYVYATDGELYNYDVNLNAAGEASIGTPTNGNGSGMGYMNDYLILPTTTNVSVYGPISGAAAITNSWWTATAGLTALTNTTYPGTRNVNYPNHAGHLHTDGKWYFCDYANGQGIINKLGITTAGANDGSAYNVLDLPSGTRPFDIESYGTDLAVIGSILGTSTSTKQGQSWLFLWDTFSDSFYRQVPIPAAFVSAILNVRGTPYIWGGSVDFGWQLYRYNGGYDVEQLLDSHEGSPPYAGAVDSYGDRICWGAYHSVPSTNASILAYGYQNQRLGSDLLNSIGSLSASIGTLPVISSLKFLQQAHRVKRPVIGWRTDTSAEYALSKTSAAATKNSYLWTQSISVGKPFKIRRIRVPLTSAVASGLQITPKIYYDENSTTKTLARIDNTNYPGESSVTYNALEIEEATTAGYTGQNNFFIEFYFDGTSATGIALPVEVEIETLDD